MVELTSCTSREAVGLADAVTRVYAEVYSDPLFENHPFFSGTRSRDRYRTALLQPAFELVSARLEDELVGYVYGFALTPETLWWETIQWSNRYRDRYHDQHRNQHGVSPLSDLAVESGVRTVAIAEIMVRRPWRRMGVARVLHDEFFSGRAEERAVLKVLPRNQPARTAYFMWGWETVGTTQSGPDAPRFACMVKRLR